MRRPINWFVFCLSLAFLFANVSLDRKPVPSVGQAEFPVTAELDFSHVILEEATATQFGYVRSDGSFMPLAQQPAMMPADDLQTVESLLSSAPSAASRVPARF